MQDFNIWIWSTIYIYTIEAFIYGYFINRLLLVEENSHGLSLNDIFISWSVLSDYVLMGERERILRSITSRIRSDNYRFHPSVFIYLFEEPSYLSLQMFLIEESDHYGLYSDSEKDELLFCLFRHLCLGGQICQYEDSIEPYLTFTKQLYKELIR